MHLIANFGAVGIKLAHYGAVVILVLVRPKLQVVEDVHRIVIDSAQK